MMMNSTMIGGSIPMVMVVSWQCRRQLAAFLSDQHDFLCDSFKMSLMATFSLDDVVGHFLVVASGPC